MSFGSALFRPSPAEFNAALGEFGCIAGELQPAAEEDNVAKSTNLECSVPSFNVSGNFFLDGWSYDGSVTSAFVVVSSVCSGVLSPNDGLSLDASI